MISLSLLGLYAGFQDNFGGCVNFFQHVITHKLAKSPNVTIVTADLYQHNHQKNVRYNTRKVTENRSKFGAPKVDVAERDYSLTKWQILPLDI